MMPKHSFKVGDLVRHKDGHPFVGTNKRQSRVTGFDRGTVVLADGIGKWWPQYLVKVEETPPFKSDWDTATRGERMSDTTGRVIFKYQMPVLEEFTMELPKGAQIIRVQDQGGMFWLWAVIDTRAPKEARHFRAFKTGGHIPDDLTLNYIGFCAVHVQMELGLYIFEVL